MHGTICYAAWPTCVIKRIGSTVKDLKTQTWWSVVAAFLFCSALTAFAQSPLRATITIDAAKVENAISPMLYGQFAEFMFEDIKGGLVAELVRDRGFDEPANAIGLPRHWERYPDDRNDDPAMSFRWDNTVFYPARVDANTLSSQHSLQVSLKYAESPAKGIRQQGIPVRAGVEYAGYVWIKSKDYSGGLTMSLQADEVDGEQYATAEVGNIAPGDWKKYEFQLRSKKSDNLAQLAILFRGEGHLWLDQLSLLPADAAQGIRRDVEEKVKALHPAFLRWPGGNVAQDYHWMWGIGPRDQRPIWVNLSWKNELEPGDFGTDEYIKFCRRIGAEPSITVNVEGRGATSDEAAAWVEYANGPATSKYGAMRAANGNSEPFRVKY
jgi:alpha-N-arabinofuranosidase